MVSKRSIIILLAVFALTVTSLALAQTGPSKDLAVVSWGGVYTRSQMLAYVQPFRSQSGEWVSMETYNGGLDEIRDQVETANIVWDVVDFELSDLIRGCREGLLETIDHSTLPPGADGTPAQDDFIPGAFTECGVGQTVWSTVIGYNSERVGETRPSSVADFFDTRKFPGKRGLRRDPRVIMEWALMADGVAAQDVYGRLESADGRAQAFTVLDSIKNDIVWWETGSDPVALLAAGTVVMTSVWNGRINTAITEQDKPFAILWDGQVWDIDSWGIPKGSYNVAKAIDFIRFSTATEQLAEQTKYIAYGPARKSSLALVSEETKAQLPTAAENMQNSLQSDADWWASHHAELMAGFEEWLAAGARGLSGSPR